MVRLSSIFGLAVAAIASVGAIPTVETRAEGEVHADNLLGEIINALGVGFVTGVNATITLDTLTTNLLSINFTAHNPLIFELTIDRVNSTAGINGTTYTVFDHTFPKGFVLPILGSANSGSIPNVLLTKGAIASLDIIPLGYLDLLNVDIWVRALTINGKLGIPLTITGLRQKNVPAAYSLAL
ncbi:hypothetical protein MIND_00553000 [Mycena indigotica]|uniref:Uncharacterized protein n=1 Tax=Mycena indigotica TaxID=2126181 RepID=A0A8H6SZE2_9AGAR|nr:uncharacterized protein MIND_00553000 [Mycena indigotica]KAF7307582.1 hypothetical protein MIND_00553000 [Mycena indigotica]